MPGEGMRERRFSLTPLKWQTSVLHRSRESATDAEMGAAISDETLCAGHAALRG